MLEYNIKRIFSIHIIFTLRLLFKHAPQFHLLLTWIFFLTCTCMRFLFFQFLNKQHAGHLTRPGFMRS